MKSWCFSGNSFPVELSALYIPPLMVSESHVLGILRLGVVLYFIEQLLAYFKQVIKVDQAEKYRDDSMQTTILTLYFCFFSTNLSV